jgi:hypothetical protein
MAGKKTTVKASSEAITEDVVEAEAAVEAEAIDEVAAEPVVEDEAEPEAEAAHSYIVNRPLLLHDRKIYRYGQTLVIEDSKQASLLLARGILKRSEG